MISKRTLIETFLTYSDHSLIAKWQKGDEAAFTTLYKRYVVQLLRIAAAKTGCLETGREIVQEAFLAIYEQRESLHTIHSLKQYLLSIVKHKVFNYYRHKLVQEKYLAYLQDNLSLEKAGDGGLLLENKELQQLLLQNIEQLPEKCREVFRLSREQQYSYRQIAEHLHISENTVDQHIRKALRVLREALVKYKGIAIVFLLALQRFCLS